MFTRAVKTSVEQDIGLTNPAHVPASEPPPTLILNGLQSLHQLVHHGRVRLYTNDGSVVEVSDPLDDPFEIGDREESRVTVRVVTYSHELRGRYPEPLPERATSIVAYPGLISACSELYGREGFFIDEWERNLRLLVLRDVVRIELAVEGEVTEELVRQLGYRAWLNGDAAAE